MKSWAISRTRRWKGSLRIRSSVDYRRVSEASEPVSQRHITVRPELIAHLLVPSDLSEGDCSRAVSVGLLYTTSSWGRLACG